MTDPAYARQQASTLAILKRKGAPITLRQVAPGAYDTTQGKVALVNTDTVRQGVKLPFASGQTVVRGEQVQAEDAQVLMDATGPLPTTQDRVIVATVEFAIVSVAAISPAGVPVLFDLHVRRT